MDFVALFIANSPLIAALAVFSTVALLSYILYYLLQAPQRQDERVVALASEVQRVTETLSRAEHIGHFGSFTWNYLSPKSSYWSEEMYAMFGLVKRAQPPPIEVFAQVADVSQRDMIAAAVKEALAKPGTFTFTFKAVAPDQSTRDVRVQGTTILRDNKPWNVYGVAHDITREVEIDRAKSEFVSLASHQLKTPLTSVRWLVEALQAGTAGQFTQPQQQFIDKIGQSTQNMIAIVNDLLNVSRIELNRLATQIEELDVKQLAESVLEEQQHAAVARKVAVSFTCASDVPHVQADRNSLRMIFQNLISNAIKYTPDGGSVSCDISLAGARQQAIYLTVADTGIGIPASEQDRVFEKLHRAKNAQALAVEGTGLGLYVVKTVIEKAGGAITFDSKEGKGTTFTVTIPLVWKVPTSAGIGGLA